jgi:serine phosphatase RsbU (regulator of sigma subunit)
VWIVRNGELIELKPDKMPVGKHDRDNESFTQHIFDLQKGDTIYALTDGMPDQFGGPKGKKFMYKQLKDFLININRLPLNEQKEQLELSFENWKGESEQVDDVLIIGVRIM